VPTGRGQTCIPLLVTPPVEQTVVELRAVDLDDDARSTEQEVDPTDPFVVTEVGLPLRIRQAVVASERDEPSLELALRSHVVAGTFLQERPEHHRSIATVFRKVDEHSPQIGLRDHLPGEGGVHSACDSAPRLPLTAEVEQRPRNCRARNPIDSRDVLTRERERLLDVNVREAPSPVANDGTVIGSSAKPGRVCNAAPLSFESAAPRPTASTAASAR
jgi:hypothetical protein